MFVKNNIIDPLTVVTIHLIIMFTSKLIYDDDCPLEQGGSALSQLRQGGCRLYKIKFKDNSRTFEELRKKIKDMKKWFIHP